MADSETVILGKREHHTLLYLVILCWKDNSSFLMCSLKWGLLVMAQLGVHGNLIITQCGCQDHLLRNFGQSFRCVPVTLCCVLGAIHLRFCGNNAPGVWTEEYPFASLKKEIMGWWKQRQDTCGKL